MSEKQYNLQFEKLCNILQLGEIIGVPEEIFGGLLHRMHAVETTQRKYAIKALNPQIMLRHTATQNFINSERIAKIAANHVTALPAKEFNDTLIQEIDNQFYLIFDWVEGRSLKTNEVDKVHCEKMGSILADIHMANFSELASIKERSGNVKLIDWDYYLQKGHQGNVLWVKPLLEIIDKLYEWNDEANKSVIQINSNWVIGHRDLDPKNVLWNLDNPIIIDWEAAGYINPMQELTETAIYWSEDETGNIEKERFFAFIRGYKKKYGILQADWRTVLLNGFLGKMGWLEYNLKRSLWIECAGAEEQQMGTAQVIETISAIRHYAELIPKLESWLNYDPS